MHELPKSIGGILHLRAGRIYYSRLFSPISPGSLASLNAIMADRHRLRGALPFEMARASDPLNLNLLIQAEGAGRSSFMDIA